MMEIDGLTCLLDTRPVSRPRPGLVKYFFDLTHLLLHFPGRLFHLTLRLEAGAVDDLAGLLSELALD